MTWQVFLDPTFGVRLCLTLVHCLWQIALLTAVVWVIDRRWPRRSVEFSYTHTARKPSRGLVTKTAELILAEAAEATKAATVIETRTETWGKLRDEMQGVMKVQQDELDEMRRKLPAFVKASDGLLQHVFATLY